MTRAKQSLLRFCKIAVITVAVLLTALTSVAQTFTVLHTFTGPDGATPESGLTMDRAGNLYGTAATGGQGFQYCNLGCGTIFKLTHTGSGWVFSPIYKFSGSDGANPRGRVVFGPDGALYGTAVQGGPHGRGVVFKLQPPASFCHAVQCLWTETILHSFEQMNDGSYPNGGDLVFDSAGNLYGTTDDGGTNFGGVVYQLVHSNGTWTENVIHNFGGTGDGWRPESGLTIDGQGNLFGTTSGGGASQDGTIYQLTHSGSGWTESIIHSFDGNTEGSLPYGSLTPDAAGNFYGTTSTGGPGGFAGTVYELSPSNGGWALNVLYSFSNVYIGSFASVTLGPNGTLYGTLNIADVDVFQLTPSGGQWTQTGVFGRNNDVPYGNVIVDANGNLYTSGAQGGPNQDGVVLQITP